MNCKEKGPVWICLNFDTFVCTTCSGIHREFNHRIKSISMATFSPEEIKRVQDNNGNEYARKVWLAKWSTSDFPVPEAGDRNRIKEFIKLCYQDKKWYQESAPPPSAHASDPDELPPQMPISKIIQNPPSLVVKTEAPKKKDDDLLGMYDAPANPPQPQPKDFFNTSFSSQGQPQTPQDKYAEAVAAIKNTQIQQQQQLNPWANSQPVQQTPWGYQPGMTYPPPQFQGQQFPGQQFPGQQYPVQGYPGQPFPGQQYPVQGYPGQPYMQQAGPFPGQVYPPQQQQQQQQQQQFPGQPFPGQQFSPPQPSFQPQPPAPVQQPTAFMNANSTNSAPSFVQEPPKGGDKYDVFSSLAMFPSSNQPAAAGNSGNPFGNSYGNKSTQQNSQQGNPFAPASATQQTQPKQPFNPFV